MNDDYTWDFTWDFQEDYMTQKGIETMSKTRKQKKLLKKLDPCGNNQEYLERLKEEVKILEHYLSGGPTQYLHKDLYDWELFENKDDNGWLDLTKEGHEFRIYQQPKWKKPKWEFPGWLNVKYIYLGPDGVWYNSFEKPSLGNNSWVGFTRCFPRYVKPNFPEVPLEHWRESLYVNKNYKE